MSKLALTGFPQPLSGLRVLDLTSVIFGPYATMMLGDLGADVIKIEAPDGDMTRAIGPRRNAHMSALFLGTNRNKRAIVLDLKTDAGKSALTRLIETSHVLVHNMRPQKMAALGFSPDEVLAINPLMIFAALVGYRGDGPYAGRPTYDDVIQGQSGIAGMFTERDGEPQLLPTIGADKASGLMATSGILAALIRRMASDRGVVVETGMMEGMAAFTLVEHQYGAVFSPPLVKSETDGFGYPRSTSRERRPYPTADGHICMLAYTDPQWHRFWTLTEQTDMANDPRFATIDQRAEHVNTLYALTAEKLKERSTADWIDALTKAEIACGTVNRLQDLKTDPHLSAINFFRAFDHPSEGPLETPDTAFRFDDETLPVRAPQPRLGEHTAEILREAGCDDALIKTVLAQNPTAENDA